MLRLTLLDKSIINGTEISRSVLFGTTDQRTFCALPDFANNFDASGHPINLFADPTFSYVIKLFISLDPRRAQCVSVLEFPNLEGIRDASWSGIARRVWASLETSRPVVAGICLTY